MTTTHLEPLERLTSGGLRGRGGRGRRAFGCNIHIYTGVYTDVYTYIQQYIHIYTRIYIRGTERISISLGLAHDPRDRGVGTGP